MNGTDTPGEGKQTLQTAEDGEGAETPRRSSLKLAPLKLVGAGLGKLTRKLRRNDADAGEPEATAAEQDAAHAVMQQNLLRMTSMRVSSAMVPRADIVAVEAGVTRDEALQAFRDCGHSRLPVFKETLDDPLGFLHIKDLFMEHGFDCEENDAAPFDATRHVRRFLTVPPSMPCFTLLQTMQAQRMHMALVIDEYGGVDGLVTIEDLLELIVGEIEDEYDSASDDGWTREGDGVYLADARAYLDDFEQETSVQFIDRDKVEDVDTLGGLVFMLCNRVPARGEVVRHPDGHEFEVLDADPRRIKRLRVTLSDLTASGGAEDSGRDLPQAAQ